MKSYNLYSRSEAVVPEKITLGNEKSEDVKFITVHPNGEDGHVIALDSNNTVISPRAGKFKGVTLASARSFSVEDRPRKGEKDVKVSESLTTTDTETQDKKATLSKSKSSKLPKKPVKVSPERALAAIPNVSSKFNAEQWDAIDAYQAEDYIEINAALRSGGKVSKSTKDAIKGLQSAFNLTEPIHEDITLYRGVGSEFVNSQDSWKDNGIVSTSPSKDIPTSYAEGGTLMVIRVPKGSRGVLPLYTGGTETPAEEVLLPPGTTFKPSGNIDGERTLKGGTRVLEVEAVVPKEFHFAEDLQKSQSKKKGSAKAATTSVRTTGKTGKYSIKDLHDSAKNLLGTDAGASFITEFDSKTKYEAGSVEYKSSFVKALLVRMAFSHH